MRCDDMLQALVFLIRWALALVTGTDLDTFWQVMRSAAVICSEGPLG